MPTRFDALLRQADAIIDNMHGETFSYEPRLKGVNVRSQPDTSRAAIASLVAYFQDTGTRSSGPSRGEARHTKAWLSIAYNQRPADVKLGDQFTRLHDGRKYEVFDIDPHHNRNRTRYMVHEVS